MDESSPSSSRRAFLGAAAGGSLAAAAGCLEAEWARATGDGTGDAEPLDVLVRFGGAEHAGSLMSDDSIARRKRRAEAAHRPFRRFAATTAGVEVRREFWIADAVLARVDPGQVTLEAIAAVEGVTELRPNEATPMEELATPTAILDGEGAETEPQSSSTASTLAPAGSASGNGSGSGSLDAGREGADGQQRQASQQGQQEGPELSYGLERIDAGAVWELYGARGEGVDVAVIDTGVDPAGHDGIASALERGGWAEFDAGGERAESDPTDPNGHGTGTSGLVVGGTTDDGVRYGVAPAAALYHAKVIGEDGMYVAALLAGLEWAVEQGVDVVSISLGPLAYPEQLIEPIENARASGVLVVGAVGNAGQYTSASPANMPSTVGVGAIDREGAVTDFSGGERIRTERYWGPAAPDGWPDEYTVPDVTAVGVDVPSADPGGEYGGAGGASAAAPQVAGVAALALSAARTSDAGEVGVDDLERAVVDSALHPDRQDDFALDPGVDDRYGAGVASAMLATTRLVADQTLSGRVSRPDGSPLAGARVIAEAGAETTTDSEGRFELQLPAGEQPVGAVAPGFEADVAFVDPASTEEIELSPQPTDAPFVALQGGPPDRIEAGEAATATFTVANVEFATVTVSTRGLLQSGALDVRIDGEPAAFGKPQAVDAQGRTQGFTVTIEVAEGARVGAFTPELSVAAGEQTSHGVLPEVLAHPDPLPAGGRPHRSRRRSISSRPEPRSSSGTPRFPSPVGRNRARSCCGSQSPWSPPRMPPPASRSTVSARTRPASTSAATTSCSTA